MDVSIEDKYFILVSDFKNKKRRFLIYEL